jgi:hypothetical protein
MFPEPVRWLPENPVNTNNKDSLFCLYALTPDHQTRVYYRTENRGYSQRLGSMKLIDGPMVYSLR